MGIVLPLQTIELIALTSILWLFFATAFSMLFAQTRLLPALLRPSGAVVAVLGILWVACFGAAYWWLFQRMTFYG